MHIWKVLKNHSIEFPIIEFRSIEFRSNEIRIRQGSLLFKSLKENFLGGIGWYGEKIIFSALASVHTGRISEPINLGMTEYNTTSSHSWCCYMMCVNLLKSTPIGKEPAGIFFLPRFFFFWNMVSAKGKIKLKTDWCAINSPKNQTDKFVLLKHCYYCAKIENSLFTNPILLGLRTIWT